MVIPTTVHRVPDNTAEHINVWIHSETQKRVARCAARGPTSIDRRLRELDEEWDIERTLEANAATAVLIGCTLGASIDRRWFAFPAIVGALLLQHAIQGWCPPLIWFRRMGVRTQSEIDYERYALKALRGDFKDIGDNDAPKAVQQAVA
jgi:hypothetical protein